MRDSSDFSFPGGLGVSFQQVTKRYGLLLALRNVSVSIHPGEFVALLGPNGSGKSTLIKLGAQAARPTSGTISFTNSKGVVIASSVEVRSRMGLVGHSSLTYDDLSAEENLVFFGKLYGVENPAARATALLDEVGLLSRKKSLARTFSRGMRQRLSIARALLPAPGILFLDEPTTGLDQSAMGWFAEYLRNLHNRGCTILMSTHGTSDVLALATRTLHLEAGSVVSGGGG